MSKPTENKAVKARILEYVVAIGWMLVSREAPNRKKKDVQLDLFSRFTNETTAETAREEVSVPKPGETVLDRIHQSMILFATGRGEALRRFLVEDGVGWDAALWKLAQSLSALYPGGS